MKHSQINHTKVWGFSRRTPNLKLLDKTKSKNNKRISAIFKTLKANNHLRSWRWLKCINTLTQKNTRLKARLQLLKKDTIVSIISIITLFGFQKLKGVIKNG